MEQPKFEIRGLSPLRALAAAAPGAPANPEAELPDPLEQLGQLEAGALTQNRRIQKQFQVKLAKLAEEQDLPARVDALTKIVEALSLELSETVMAQLGQQAKLHFAMAQFSRAQIEDIFDELEQDEEEDEDELVLVDPATDTGSRLAPQDRNMLSIVLENQLTWLGTIVSGMESQQPNHPQLASVKNMLQMGHICLQRVAQIPSVGA